MNPSLSLVAPGEPRTEFGSGFTPAQRMIPLEIKLREKCKGIAALIEEEAMLALREIRAAKESTIRRIEAMAPPAELDIKQAAKQLGVSATTLRRRVKHLAIAHRHEGVKLVFTQAALDEYRRASGVAAREVYIPV